MARKLGQGEDRGPIVQVQGDKREEANSRHEQSFRSGGTEHLCVWQWDMCMDCQRRTKQDDFASHIMARSDWAFSKQSLSSSVEDLLDWSQSGG